MVETLSEDTHGYFLVSICLFFLFFVLIIPKNNEYGTVYEEKELMDKVVELQTSGYSVNRRSSSVFDFFIPDKLIENYTDFVTFLQTNNLTNLHYTTEGTFGPKLWLNYNGTFYYWRAD